MEWIVGIVVVVYHLFALAYALAIKFDRKLVPYIDYIEIDHINDFDDFEDEFFIGTFFHVMNGVYIDDDLKERGSCSNWREDGF